MEQIEQHSEKCECPRCNITNEDELINGHLPIETLQMIVGMCRKCGYVFVIKEEVNSGTTG